MAYFAKRFVFLGAVLFFVRYVIPGILGIPEAISLIIKGEYLAALELLVFLIIYTSITIVVFVMLWRFSREPAQAGVDSIEGHYSLPFKELPPGLQKEAQEFHAFLKDLIVEDSGEGFSVGETKTFLRDDSVDRHGFSVAIGVLNQQKEKAAILNCKILDERKHQLRKDKKAAILYFEIMAKDYALKWFANTQGWKLNILDFLDDLKGQSLADGSTP